MYKKCIIPFILIIISSFSCNAQYYFTNYKCGFINTKNELISTFEYDWAFPFYEGVAAVKKGNKWGFINKDNKYVIDPIYDYTLAFNEGLAPVAINKKFGFINKEGKIVISLKYDAVSCFEQSIAAVQIDGKVGYIDMKGNYIVEPEYDNFAFLQNDLLCVEKDDNWGYLNKEGKVVIPLKYDNAFPFSENFAYVEKDGNSGYINKENTNICNFKYEKMIIFNLVSNTKSRILYSILMSDEGEYNIRTITKWGRIGFYNGLGIVKNKNGFGYIDSNGTEIINCQYDRASIFNNGIAVVGSREDGKYEEFLINKKNGIVFKQNDVQFILPSTDNYITFSDISKKTSGLMNFDGKILFERTKTGIASFEGKYAITNSLTPFPKTKFGFISDTGKIISDLKYDFVFPFSEERAMVAMRK